MTSQPPDAESAVTPASFRDPAGRLFTVGDRVVRSVADDALEVLNQFLASEVAKRFLHERSIVATRVLADDETRLLLRDPDLARLAVGRALVEHERIPFPSYPYEWPAEMLHAAGCLTLDLAHALLADGFSLKDATPYNVLFRGSAPVFVDLLSFERRDPRDPTWLPYAQFVRTFLLPLLVHKYYGLPLDQVLLTRRDGLEPEEVYRWVGPLRKLLPPFFSLVSLPVWLAASSSNTEALYKKRQLHNAEKAQFILDCLIQRQRRLLRRLAPAGRRRSTWSGYMRSKTYTEDQFAAKEAFVRAALDQFAPARVLDVGCNTGHFSFLAASRGAEVVAIDYDPAVVGELFLRARAGRLDILPLVVNLARPTPSVGWRNAECRSFLQRAQGAFDMVFLLAVIHHMAISERIPLDDVLATAAGLTTKLVIAESIGPTDPMFRQLVRGRDPLYQGLTHEAFEERCRRWFRILNTQHLAGADRRLYLLQKIS